MARSQSDVGDILSLSGRIMEKPFSKAAALKKVEVEVKAEMKKDLRSTLTLTSAHISM